MRIFFIILFSLSVGANIVVQRECNTHADCNTDECCVSKVKLRGRRSVLTKVGNGLCTEKYGEGESCYVSSNSAIQSPTDIAYTCTCKEGLFCKGNGQKEIPLGEKGTCEKET